MRNRRTAFAAILVLVSAMAAAGSMFLQGIVPVGSVSASADAGKKAASDAALIGRQQVMEQMGSVGVYFEENRGQHHPAVNFTVNGATGNRVFLTQQDAVFVAVEETGQTSGSGVNGESRQIKRPSLAVAVYMTLSGANRSAEHIGIGELEHRTNYFIGGAADHWTDIPNYREVRSSGIYPGVDLSWRGTADGILEPVIMADSEDALAQVEWNISGAQKVSITDDGGIVFDTDAKAMKVAGPVVVIRGNSFTREQRASFEYDPMGRVKVSADEVPRSGPIHIAEPDVAPGLIYSTFLGTNIRDDGNGIAIDPSGNAYITGFTLSTAFPTTPGTFNPSNSGSWDMFVTKFNATGSSLVYSTYLGGNADDYGGAIAVDTAGSAYVAGTGRSSNYPTTTGAFDTTSNGDFDILFTKLNPAGNALVYSTYIGGSSVEFVNPGSIDFNAAGNAYLTGETESANFPTTPGAFDTTVSGRDAFALKFDVSGSSLEYSTFLGGNGSDRGTAIAVDASGNAHVVGVAANGTFPTTAGAFQTTIGGADDAFLT